MEKIIEIPVGHEAEIKDGKVVIREKMSEDERIRKFLINKFGEVGDVWKEYSTKDIIAWLEKQKPADNHEPQCDTCTNDKGCVTRVDGDQWEGKPAEWSEEDDRMKQDAIRFIETGWTDNGKSHLIPWLKTLPGKFKSQPKQEWSEEEKSKLYRIYSILGRAAGTHAFSTACRLIGDKEAEELQDFLRSIAMPQVRNWKPSGEQMDVLSEMISFCAGHKDDYVFRVLNELRDDLKKLM